MTDPVHIREQLPTAALIAFCQQWPIAELAVFGSVLRDDFTPDSDIDVLVRLLPDTPPSLTLWLTMAEALETLLGRRVDLIDRAALEASPNYLRRRQILQTAQVIYAR